MSNMKTVKEANIGDTFFFDQAHKENIEPFPGYDTPQPMVFAGMYPEDPDDYEDLERALQKLALTDGSVSISFEQSAALGSGFRLGFLGMLHMDVFRQRMIEEYSIVPIITHPSITYLAENINGKGERFKVDNPNEIENYDLIKYWYEPICTCTIMTPIEYLKNVKSLCNGRRSMLEKEEFINDGQLVNMTYAIPLSEIVIDFFDNLKSIS